MKTVGRTQLKFQMLNLLQEYVLANVYLIYSHSGLTFKFFETLNLLQEPGKFALHCQPQFSLGHFKWGVL